MFKFKKSKPKVAIVGYFDGDAGQIECWFEKVTGYSISCFIWESESNLIIDEKLENSKRVTKQTEYPTATSFKGRPFIVTSNLVKYLLDTGISKVLILTHNNKDRLRQIEDCRMNSIDLISAIHPTAIISEQSYISPGVWINAGVFIGYKAEIKSGVIINTGAQIDHHNVLEEASQVNPAVVTCGNVTLRQCAELGANATILGRIEIGQHSFIGAGAVVTTDIPPYTLAVGIPAKPIKKLH